MLSFADASKLINNIVDDKYIPNSLVELLEDKCDFCGNTLVSEECDCDKTNNNLIVEFLDPSRSVMNGSINFDLQAPLTGIINSQMSKIHTWGIYTYRETKNNDSIELIRQKTSKLSQQISIQAVLYYNKLYANSTSPTANIRAGNYYGFMTCCIFYAAKKYYHVLLNKDLMNIFNLTKKNIKNGKKIFNQLSFEIKLTIPKFVYTLNDYINFYYKKFKFNETHLLYLNKLATNLTNMHICDNKCFITQTAYIYYYAATKCNIVLTKNTIKDVLYLSIGTLNIVIKMMKPYTKLLENTENCLIVNKKIIQHASVTLSNCAFNK